MKLFSLLFSDAKVDDDLIFVPLPPGDPLGLAKRQLQ